MKQIIIDHDDSFTFILAQYFGEVTGQIPTIANHREFSIKKLKEFQPSHIILSPGPGTVNEKEDFQIGFETLKEFAGTVPILGVCLGHQGIGAFYGAEIVHAPEVMHGKKSTIFHNGDGIFHNVPNSLNVMRYHSLMIEPGSLPAELELTAWTEDNLIMGIQHRKLPVYGVQFHPESFGTEHGIKLIQNFCAMS